MKTSREVALAPHNPAWRDEFERVAAEVCRCLAANLVAVHHIGSTAIPTVAYAKPVIDILAEVSSIQQVDQHGDAMARRSFEARGEYGIPGRRYFVRSAADGCMAVHLHVYASGDAQIDRHLAFRDYLLAHPEEARAYSELKRDLAGSDESDRASYQSGKADFIARSERGAAQWKPHRDS